MISTLKIAFAASALVAGYILPANASAACTLYFSTSKDLVSVSANSTYYPESFTMKCQPGSISGTATAGSNGTQISMKLEKQINGVWTVVATNSGLNYSGTTGNYRYVVINGGAAGFYKLQTSHP